MFSSRVLVIALWAVFTAADVVFEDSATNPNGDNSNVGTRNAGFDDSVVIEAAGSPPSGNVDSRFFGLLGGLLGGNNYGSGIGGGYPIGGGYTKPGKCPGILGLGLGQPQGGYYPQPGYGGYGNGGYGHAGGYPGYGGYPPYGGYGGYGPYPAQYGLGGYGGHGFRSGDQGEIGAKSGETRRKRSEESSANKESGDVQGRNLPGGSETDARFLGGVFGRTCFTDGECPGQMKCCGTTLGRRATCQQPGFLG